MCHFRNKIVLFGMGCLVELLPLAFLKHSTPSPLAPLLNPTTPYFYDSFCIDFIFLDCSCMWYLPAK